MVYLFLSVIFFAIAALIYKHSNQINCDRISLILSERIFAVVFMVFYIYLFDTFKPALNISLLAFTGGTAIFVSRLALLTALKYGKISSSWTAVNLSVVIPTTASILLWKEIPSLKQVAGLLLVPAAIFLLQEDKKCG